MRSPLRDDFHIQGYRFGEGKPMLAIVGAMRGDEVMQQFVCSQMVKVLSRLEAEGNITPGQEVLVIPNANHFSMNIGKRFWAMDSTDINRMFPGYDLGETTQRIAAALFNNIKGFEYGIQLASFYIPGNFIPHIRMMNTGYQPTDDAMIFGLPYVYVRQPRPYDTTILNYNWQIWDTKAFSLFAGTNNSLSEPLAHEACRAILRFMAQKGIIKLNIHSAYKSTLVTDDDILSVRAQQAGYFYKHKDANDYVSQGETLATILHPYDGSVLQTITAPHSGSIFFAHTAPLVYQNTILFNIVKE